jgi:hypothetical protein
MVCRSCFLAKRELVLTVIVGFLAKFCHFECADAYETIRFALDWVPALA